MSIPTGPLQGIRVLDFSKVLAGPLCTQYMADMGAEVVKVEPKDGDDTRRWPPFEGGDGTVFVATNRNKKSVSLDLKTGAGREICRRLVERADVVIESFGPGVARRLGIDEDSLRPINPAIVYCSISGFGSVGSMREGKGYDVILQAFSGMISITGEPDGPPARSPFSPVDQATGLHALIGILGALFERQRTGKGARVEASLFDSSVGFLGYFLQAFWQRGSEPVRAGSGHESLCPYQVFDTSDKPLILGVANDTLWRAFCGIAGEPALAQEPGWVTNAERVANRARTVARVSAIMATRSRDQWIADLGAAGIPCSPVHTLGELSAHPHTTESGMVFEYDDPVRGKTLKGVAQPLRFNGARLGAHRAPPALGQHGEDVLRDAGFSNEEIAGFVRAGVLGAGDETHRTGAAASGQN